MKPLMAILQQPTTWMLPSRPSSIILKASGLYENSIIVLYGDHYGISNSRNPALAPLLDKNSETWSSYDNAMLQPGTLYGGRAWHEQGESH